MQLFILHKDPVISANRLASGNQGRWLKMITETQQILACALDNKVRLVKVNGEHIKRPVPYMNHPVVNWVRDKEENAAWTIDYLKALYSNYTGDAFTNVPENISRLESLNLNHGEVEFLNFAKAAGKGIDYTWEPDVFKAYKLFLERQKHWRL